MGIPVLIPFIVDFQSNHCLTLKSVKSCKKKVTNPTFFGVKVASKLT